MHSKAELRSHASSDDFLNFKMPSNEEEFTDLLSVFCDRLLDNQNFNHELAMSLVDLGFIIAFEGDDNSLLQALKVRVQENIRVADSLISG